MKTADYQRYLLGTKRYAGAIDGDWGRLTDAGTLLMLSDGPDTALIEGDYTAAGQRLGVDPAAIKAFWKTEAAGAGFQDGKPKVLPESHRFSRNTARIFDKQFPQLSYPKWGTRPYPKTQDARYDVLLAWCRMLSDRDMDLDAAFASVSYGAPQIMGENAKLCGYPDPITFAAAMARDEVTQLNAFMTFVRSAGILKYLQQVTRDAKTWEKPAELYNGSAWRQNDYAGKMARAYASFGGK